jgi:hypothetical protein
MAALTETQLITALYALYESDDAGWASTDSEYLTARSLMNVAIADWEMRQTWRVLWTTLTGAADGDKTTTAGDWSYNCPTNFKKPSSWVRTTDGTTNTFWQVIPTEMVAKYASDYSYFCYFIGSEKDGFDLQFNPRITLTTGHTINYEYYKTPTLYSGTTTTSEIPDPYYCVYYALSRLLKNDGEDFNLEEGKAREILSRMEINNMEGLWDISNAIEEPLGQGVGFGV